MHATVRTRLYPFPYPEDHSATTYSQWCALNTNNDTLINHSNRQLACPAEVSREKFALAEEGPVT